MTDVLTRLREANPVPSEDLAPSIERVWQMLEDPALAERWPPSRRPPRRRFFPPAARAGAWRRFVLVAAGSAAVLIAVLVFGTAGGGPPNAFAGWSANPTAAARGETASALDRCSSQLAAARGPRTGTQAGSWKPLLTDTRGPFTAMILQAGGASATCLNGPTFTSTTANATEGAGASSHTLSMRRGSGHTASSVSVMGLGGPRSGPISEASQVHASTSAGHRYTIVQGQVRAGVRRVTLVLSDGRDVQATVGDGSFIAWWPGSAAARFARLATTSGATTQRLTFTHVPVPMASPSSATYGTSSSP